MKLHLPKILLVTITAAFVCVSPAYAADVTISTSGDNKLTSTEAGKTIEMNLDGYLQSANSGGGKNVDANIEVTKWTIGNGWSNSVYCFNGSITGSGSILFNWDVAEFNQANPHYTLLGSKTGNLYRFTGDVSGFSGNITSNRANFDVEFASGNRLDGSTSTSSINKNCVSGTGAISVAGELTYKVDGASHITNSAIGTKGVLTFLNGDTENSTYTIGNGSDKTTATAGTLTIAQNASVILAANSEMVVNNPLDIQGSLTVNGTLEVAGEAYLTDEPTQYTQTTEGGTTALNGYIVTDAWIIANKEITIGQEGSLKGVVSTEYIDGVGLVATTQNLKVADKTRFYANEGTVRLGEDGYTDYTATTYYVAGGATLDLNGQAFGGKKVSLAENATLTNTAGTLNDNSILLTSIELTGNATLATANNHGLLSYAWGDTNLALNGHTLTKTGSGTFYLVKTGVTGGGKIATAEGTLQIGTTQSGGANRITSAEGVEFSVSEGATLSMVNGAQLHAKSISGDGTISGADSTTLKLTSDTDSSFNGSIEGGFALIKEGSGKQTFNGHSILGAITLNGGTLAIGGVTEAASLTMTGDTALEFGKEGLLNLTGSITLNAGAIKMADGIVFDSTDSFTLINIEGEDASITFDDIEQWSSDVYTIGNVDYTLALDNAGKALIAHFQVIPEPATATLSLLALCGLAMRRRRK